jgi:hypothetical protein
MEYERVRRAARAKTEPARASSFSVRNVALSRTAPVAVQLARAVHSLSAIALHPDEHVPVVRRASSIDARVVQRAGEVIQRDGMALAKEKITAAATKLWELIKSAHTTKAAPAILNSLSLITAAVRYARNDTSVGATFGTSLLALLTAAEAAWTAVEEWQAATGEGKALWDKRVGAIEKVTTTLIVAASIFALPFSPSIATALAGIGTAGVKVLRSGYDWLANRVWNAPPQEGFNAI